MAAPTVGAVMADILPYLGVAQNWTEADPASRRVAVEDMTGMTKEEAKRLLDGVSLTGVFAGEGETVTGQIPAPGQNISGGSQVLLYLGEETPVGTVSVPDFAGMNRQQAADAAGKLGLSILITGNNEISQTVVVTAQSIPAGEQVAPMTMIQLEFTDTAARD